MSREACLLIRRNWNYRTDCFIAGLQRCGFEVTDNPNRPKPGDILVMWNRHLRYEKYAKAYEARGNIVLVAENGWVGSDEDGNKLIALARSHHNGAGSWHVGETDRWERLGVPLAPWRMNGEHILVLPQRGIGEAGVAMPRNWEKDVLQRLRAVTRRRLVVRPHPGLHFPPEPDFTGAWAAVTWASGAGIKAICAGVPVFHEFKRWIGASAARFGIEHIEAPFTGDRVPMLRRLAWAQWTFREIATGEPIQCLIG